MFNKVLSKRRIQDQEWEVIRYSDDISFESIINSRDRSMDSQYDKIMLEK